MSTPCLTPEERITTLEARIRAARRGSRERAFWETKLLQERRAQNPEVQKMIQEALEMFPDLRPEPLPRCAKTGYRG